MSTTVSMGVWSVTVNGLRLRMRLSFRGWGLLAGSSGGSSVKYMIELLTTPSCLCLAFSRNWTHYSVSVIYRRYLWTHNQVSNFMANSSCHNKNPDVTALMYHPSVGRVKKKPLLSARYDVIVIGYYTILCIYLKRFLTKVVWKIWLIKQSAILLRFLLTYIYVVNLFIH